MATKKTTKTEAAKTVETKAVETKAVKEVKAVETKPAKEEKAAKEVKPAAKKAACACKSETFIQFAGNEIAEADVIAKIKDAFKGDAKKMPAIKSIKVYLKPEENAAYYVINETETGKVSLF